MPEPMPTPSYLSTFLWSQQLRGADTFARKYVGDWLVWEPGAWVAPTRGAVTTMKIDSTSRTPQHGDALCFLLGPADGRTLAIGRGEGNDVLISDATVSRQHAHLTGHAGAWQVRVADGRAATLSGASVTAPATLLQPGQVLQLGGVQLSFHDMPSLLRRLSQ